MLPGTKQTKIEMNIYLCLRCLAARNLGAENKFINSPHGNLESGVCRSVLLILNRNTSGRRDRAEGIGGTFL